MQFQLAILLLCLTRISIGADGCKDLLSRREVALSFQLQSLSQNEIALACFDAHKTLYVTRGGEIAPQALEDIALLPGVARKLKEHAQDGYLIAVFSNQPRIPVANSQELLLFVAHLLALEGAEIHYIDFPGKNQLDHPDFKPGTGMARRLERALQERFGRAVDWGKSFMVGDSADELLDGTAVDFDLAKNLEISFYDPSHFFGWPKRRFRTFADLYSPSNSDQ